MRPTIDEILAGVERTLDEVVLPDLQSSFARSRGRMALRMVAYVRRVLSGQADWLATEEAALADLLTAARDTLRRLAAESESGPTAGHVAYLDGLLDRSEANSPPDATTGAMDQRVLELTAALDLTIRLVDSLEEKTPEPRLAGLQTRIRTYLRESLERELALTGTRRETVAP